jgi:hypothetical protein
MNRAARIIDEVFCTILENRNGSIVDTETFEANGTAERDAGLVMLERVEETKRVTVGADKPMRRPSLLPAYECDAASGLACHAVRAPLPDQRSPFHEPEKARPSVRLTAFFSPSGAIAPSREKIPRSFRPAGVC